MKQLAKLCALIFGELFSPHYYYLEKQWQNAIIIPYQEDEDMSYNIAVCDDLTTDRAYVIGFVQQWSAKNGHKVNISSFPSAENFLFLYDTYYSPNTNIL